jgi:hypothetical protein
VNEPKGYIDDIRTAEERAILFGQTAESIAKAAAAAAR